MRMNLIRRNFLKILSRSIETRSNIADKITLVAEPLKERSLIRVEGDEVVSYLQGLVTNDINHVHRGAYSIYTMFLNNTGRVLYDSIIYRTADQNVYLIECDKKIASDLRRHLRLFRVRRKIDVTSVSSEYTPWVIFHDEINNPQLQLEDKSKDLSNETFLKNIRRAVNDEEVIISQDPRIKSLGIRVIMPKPFEINELNKILAPVNILPVAKNYDYKYLRYKLGIGEGIGDHPPTKCFPLEANCDFLHGVSFHKGCYVGQELTARVYHTGVIRKRLMPIRLKKKINNEVNDLQTISGSVVGTIRGIHKNYALALVRVENAVKAQSLFIDGDPCELVIPDWWPKELPSITNVKEKRMENM